MYEDWYMRPIRVQKYLHSLKQVRPPMLPIEGLDVVSDKKKRMMGTLTRDNIVWIVAR
jgi:hypothetical protein